MSSADQITFVGTATTVIQVAALTILTDPNFLQRGRHAYVGLGVTTKRLTEPSLAPGQLPEPARSFEPATAGQRRGRRTPAGRP